MCTTYESWYMHKDWENMSDGQIAARIRAGDDAAFAYLFRKFYTDLVRFSASQIGRVDIAEELVCEVFASVHARRSQWNPTGRLDTYLFRAVRNLTYNYLRDKKRETANLQRIQYELAGLKDTESQDPKSDMKAAVERALYDLPDRAREVVSLRWRQGLSFEDIAEILGTTPGAVRTQLSRGMAVLRELAKGYFEKM